MEGRGERERRGGERNKEGGEREGRERGREGSKLEAFSSKGCFVRA
jgi:hypothetical protein